MAKSYHRCWFGSALDANRVCAHAGQQTALRAEGKSVPDGAVVLES
jgi:hypothetical protein